MSTEQEFEFENETCVREEAPGFWVKNCNHAEKRGAIWACKFHECAFDREEHACAYFQKDTKKYVNPVKIY